VLRWVSLYRHAVVNTPVARWALIARRTAYSNRFPVPSGGGLPHIPARSATTLDVSRPAQRSLALRPVSSPSRHSDPFVSKASTVSFPPLVASIATGWSDPVAGWELHPLKINTFSRRTGMASPEVRPDTKGAHLVVRGGGDDGFRPYVALCADRKTGAVYMTNCDHANVGPIIDKLLSTAAGREEQK
jgi:hypothetical protein